MLEISGEALQSLNEQNAEFQLIDVREDWERNLVHMGGTHIPMQQLLESLQSFNLDAHIILYCHHGVRSLMAARYLQTLGFQNAQSLTGGIDLWAKKIDTTLQQY